MATRNPKTKKSILVAEPPVVEFYANVVAANVTPLDFNLIFSRVALPVNSQPGKEVNLLLNQKYLARVTLPVMLLPALIRVLQTRLESAEKHGMLKLTRAEPIQRKAKS